MICTGLEDDEEESGDANEATVEDEDGWFPHGSKIVRQSVITM